jgi:hypothetical protein
LNLSSSSSKNIKFYIFNNDEITWFISPNIDNLILYSNIETKCNYNGVCDISNGENFLNCRTDCFSIEDMIKYLIIIFVSILLFYTFIQQWYSINYEKKIFPNNIQLQNLVNFILLSKKSGLTEKQIKEKLLIEGWTEERVSYAFRKSKGKSIMLEIKPLSKIKMLFNKSNKKDNSSS